MKDIATIEVIEQKIFVIRGHNVIIDRDLASLYGVETKTLNRAVRRNIRRFPDDFMFQLTRNEMQHMRCHFGTSSWGGRRYRPYVFTEQGVAMLSSVLHSERAIQVNIVIMRAFVKLRKILSTHKELVEKLIELERRVENHDTEIQAIFEAIRQLMKPPVEKPKRKIGFSKD